MVQRKIWWGGRDVMWRNVWLELHWEWNAENQLEEEDENIFARNKKTKTWHEIRVLENWYLLYMTH
jgi:hypothetical protein